MGRTSDAKEKLIEAAWELIWAGSYGGTSVDQICERAGVRKGSFYHFFASKAELAMAGLEDAWKRHLAELDHIFSPQHPPLDRLKKLCEYVVQDQRECAAKHGRVLGCPVHSLGTIPAKPNPATRAKIASAYMEGVLMHARILNDLKVLDALAAGVLMIARMTTPV